MVFFRKKRETRLRFRDKALRLRSGGHPDPQTGQVTVNVTNVGWMHKTVPLTIPMSALEVDTVALLTSNIIIIDVPNFYSNGQPVPIADRKETMLRERLFQREHELIFAKKQLNSANQALNNASVNPEDLLDKRVEQLTKLAGVVAPFIKSGKKSERPSVYMPPEMPYPPIIPQED